MADDAVLADDVVGTDTAGDTDDQELVADGESVELDGSAESLTDEDSNPLSEDGADAIRESLVTLGFVSFDGTSSDNATSGVMVAEEHRADFRREAYVGIRDKEQKIEFLGRIVDGPFHAPHEIGADSAVSRTTLLHPERTRFRASYYVSGAIEILGQITEDGHIIPTSTRPRPYSHTYLFPPARLQQMLGLVGSFNLGHLLGYPEVAVHADVTSKSFLPRNVGIFGTVGSGKSNTTQVLMEEATRAGWAVVVVDVEGEYVRMDEPTTDARLTAILQRSFELAPKGVADVSVYVPSSGTSDALSPTQFKVPIAAVEPHVIGDLLELTEPQMRMLYQLYESLVKKAPARKQSGASSSMPGITGSGATQVGTPFTLQHVIDALDEDKNNPGFRKLSSTEQNTAHALKSKFITLGTSGVLDWNATQSTPVLPVSDLLTPGRLSILDVSETDDRSRNITISYLLKALFELVVETARGDNIPGTSVARPPVLVVLEEVHTFVSRASVSKMRAVLDQLQIVSRRGRKRWMGLTLVSQQPGHVPDELFELANTRFIHQLKSTSNLNPVKQTTGGVHDALWPTVPSLAPGDCLLTGALFRNPIFTTIRPAQSRRMHID
jgi:hypothetical protein